MEKALFEIRQETTQLIDHTMDKESDALELKVEPPATDATQINQSVSAEETEKKLPNIDPKLNGLLILEKNDRPNEELPATEGGFVTHENLEGKGAGDGDGK